MSDTRTTRSQKRSLVEASDLTDNVPVATVTPVVQKRAKPSQTKSKSKDAPKAVKSATKSASKVAPKTAPKIASKAAPKSNSRLHAKSKAPPKRKAKATTTPVQPSTPSNPRATLTGLPAELRLHVYSHLRATAMIHVHCHRTNVSEERFTWTPCRDTNPSNPLLCANPKWSGMCAEEERCTYNKLTPGEPRGFFALAASCKALRSEIGDSYGEGVFIKQHELLPWLGYLEKNAPRQLEQLRRITIEGTVTTFMWLSQDNIAHNIKRNAPRLEAVAVQGLEPFRRFITTSMNGQFQVHDNWWRHWYVADCMREFGAEIDVTAEFMALCDPKKNIRSWYNGEVLEQQIAVRLVRSKIGGSGVLTADGAPMWRNEDIHQEIIQPMRLAEPKKNAKWRQWCVTELMD